MNRALRAATMGVLLFSPVVLSACSAGQVTQTATQERDKTGAQAQVGDISVRQGELLSPRGGTYERGDDAELQLTLVNGGSEDDTLVSVDAECFSSAEMSSGDSSSSSSPSSSSPVAATTGAGTPGAANPSVTPGAAIPSATPGAATPSAAPAPGGGDTSTPVPTSASSSSATTGSSGSQTINIPAGQSVFIGGDQYTITLTDLSKDLTPGQYLEITLTFEKAGQVTIPVTVANPSSSVPRNSSFNFNEDQGGSENAARTSEASNN